MSQFAMMIPLQSSGAGQKMTTGSPLQAATEADTAGLSFGETLGNLSETNPNAAALLLALQQMGMLSDNPVNLQMGGSMLPLTGESAGKPLPQSQLQTTQLQSLQSFTLQGTGLPSPQQLVPEAGGKLSVIESAQALAKAGLMAGEGFQLLDARGGSDLNTPMLGLGLTGQTSLSPLGIRPSVSLPLQIPVGQSGWDSAVGEKIQWMVSRQVQSAEIKLTPPDLGPMQIKLSVQNDQTSVNFIAPHAATRDALEAAIPRLREMFGEIQLNLANVDVSQQQTGSSRDGSGEASAGSNGYDEVPGSHKEEVMPSGVRVATLQSRGILDTYA